MKKGKIIDVTGSLIPHFLFLMIILLTISCAQEINPYNYAPPSKEYEWSPDNEVETYFPEKSDLSTISKPYS